MKNNFEPKLLALAISYSVALSGISVSNHALGASGLEEVVVTARKREESLQDVPVAVSVLTASQLNDRGVFSTSDLNNAMPGLNVTSSYGETQPNFTIRGIGVGTEYNSNAASPNGIYVDEVYQSMRASHGQQLYDLAQIEVVRGPQGTLYGRNTTGGAINFITNKPSFDETTSGYLVGGIGNYDRVNATGAIDFTPIPEQLGIRIAGNYVNSDPYIKNRMPAGISTVNPALPDELLFGHRATGTSPGGDESWGVRGTAHWAGERSDFIFKAYASETEGGQGSPQSRGLNGNIITLANSALGPLYNPAFGLTNFLPPAYSSTERGLSNLEIEADSIGQARVTAEGVVLNASFELTDNLTLTSVSGYDEASLELLPYIDCDGTPYLICAIGYESQSESFNQDFRLSLSGDDFSLIMGLYYGEDEIVTNNRPNFYGFLSDTLKALGFPPDYFNPGGLGNGIIPGIDGNSLISRLNATQDYTQARESVAIYGEGTYDFNETFSLTVGLRYTEDDFEYKDALTTFFDDTGAPRLYTVSDYTDAAGNPANYAIGVSAGTANPLSRKDDSSEVTGRVILDWNVSDEVMLYASYSKGYRGGTYNGLAFQSAAQVYFVEPETVDAYEVGIKSRFFDNRVQLNASAFIYDYKGRQEQLLDPNAVTFLVNLDGELKGFEAELVVGATPNLSLNAGISILDSSYDSGDCSAAITSAVPQNGNCLSTGVGKIDVGGNPFPYAPDVSANIGFDWDIMEIAGGMIVLAGSAAYSDQYFFDTFGDYSYTSGTPGQPGFVDAGNAARGPIKDGNDSYYTVNGRLSWVTDSFTVSLWGKNITDQFYYGNGINVEGSYASNFLVRTAPRTYGLELRYDF